ncbi:STON1 protein, partial [Polypterus senegalus]
MCSENHPSWVKFDDDNTAFQLPQKPLQSPDTHTGIPRPNGLKLNLPSYHEYSRRSSSLSSSPLTSPLTYFNGSPCVPSNTPLCTPIRETPGSSFSMQSGLYNPYAVFKMSLPSNSNSSALPVEDISSDSQNTTRVFTAEPSISQTAFTPEMSGQFLPFQEDNGHSNPFLIEAQQSGSSSSGSEHNLTENNLSHFYCKKETGDPRRSHIQNSFNYICEKLARLQACETEERSALLHHNPESRGFVPQGLFCSENRDGWPLMLRIPEKKNRMSSRQWGPIYLKLLRGGVLQMYYEKGLEKPFKEFQLNPYCRLSEHKVENFNEPGKIHTVKIEHVSYTEKKKYHPKAEVVHEAEVEQLLKFGSTSYGDFVDLLNSIEEELMSLPGHSLQRKHYEEQELTLEIVDNLWAQLSKDGTIIESTVITRVFCLAFVNGSIDCFLALNDSELQNRDPNYSEDVSENWIDIADYSFHKCVKEDDFQKLRIVKFMPHDACRFELMRFRTLSANCDLPFSIKAVVTVQGAYIELQAFLNMSTILVHSDYLPACENVVVQIPVPGEWIKVSRTVSLLRQKSLKSKMNRNACLGSVSTAETEQVMQVTTGTVKYEDAFGAIVWRIDRLPAKNAPPDHPHCFSCRLELGSDQEIPSTWYPYITVEFEVACTAASQTRVISLGIESDIQPQKHIFSKARYRCQPKLYRSIIEDVIESVHEIFVDEGIEEQVLKDLKQMWESKIMQSKAVEGFVNETFNPSNFVLQLPPNFNHTLQKSTASIVIPAGQNVQNFTSTDVNTQDSLATFRLQPGVNYPVQIPAGVTLQTSSGHLYKVNVPVMVTRASGNQRVLQQPVQPLLDQRKQVGGQGCGVQNTIFPNVSSQRNEAMQQCSSGQAVQQVLIGHTVNSSQMATQQQVVLQPQVAINQVLLQHSDNPSNNQRVEEAQDCNLIPSIADPISGFPVQPNKSNQVLNLLMEESENATFNSEIFGQELYDDANSGISEGEKEIDFNTSKDYNFNDLKDVIQIDGTYDSSSEEDVENLKEVMENEFLGIISTEDIKALEEDDSSCTVDSSSVGDEEPPEEIIEEAKHKSWLKKPGLVTLNAS